jgi:hypothetical protein
MSTVAPSRLLPETAFVKVDIMFDGVRYTQALGDAAATSAPNFYPYRFAPGEPDPTGTGKAAIPYLFTLDDGTLIRIKGNVRSPWHIESDGHGGHVLCRDGTPFRPITFVPRPRWLDQNASDGAPMAQTGAEALGDMLVINVAPGCQYFMEKEGGRSMRCTFCGYGRPDDRMVPLGQKLERTALEPQTYARMKDTIAAAVKTDRVSHVYLVGGSLTDWAEEGRRFLDIARAAREALGHGAYLSLGSGAIPTDLLRVFKEEDLVDGCCFNLEVWSEPLFASVCPGKNRFVGWSRWLESLYDAAELFGPGNVYSAMVAGVEMEPEHGGLSIDDAISNAMGGARTLLDRGVIPLWSIYWPLWGQTHPERLAPLREYFERLNAEYAQVRAKAGVKINPRFQCPSCAYMQLEVDLDRTF